MVKVFSVSLTGPHVVIIHMVLIEETGFSLMELDCLSLQLMFILLRFVYNRELKYVVTLMLTLQLVSIAVIFQLMLSMMMKTS